MIPKHTIQTIREAANEDIVTIIGEHLSLKKSGKDFKAKCPFHSDTKPSLSISESRGMFKCFVCGEGGDSVHFLMEHTGKEYIDIIKELANRYHIPIEERKSQGAKEETKKEAYTRPDKLIRGFNAMKSRIRKEGYVVLFFSDREKEAFLDLETTPWLQLQHPIQENQAKLISNLCKHVAFRCDTKILATTDFIESIKAFLKLDITEVYFLHDDLKPEVRIGYGNKFDTLLIDDWMYGLINGLSFTETSRKSIINLIALIESNLTRSLFKQSFFTYWEEKQTPNLD